MMRLSFSRRRAATLGTLVVAAGCVFAAGASLYSSNAPSLTLLESSEMDAVWNGALLARTLATAGISPESLSASGVAANQVADVVSRARTYLVENGNSLTSALNAAREAKASYQALERRVSTGVSSEQERTAFATAATARTSAEAARGTAIESLFQAATAGLASERVTTLRNLQSNRGWEVPAKYRAVASRTESQWVALREALAHVRITEQAGNEPNADQETLISNADAENAVVAAAAGLENLASVTTAWNSAIQ